VGHLRRYDKANLPAALDGLPVEIEDLRYWGLSLLPALALRKLLLGGGNPTSRTLRFGMSPPNRLAHSLLKAMKSCETTLLRRPLLGTSLMLAAKK